MSRPKNESGSDRSADDAHAVRRRVIKACQRCRLKKCKCDGSTPCTRCTSDDSICAYGKHKKSDKTVFRTGYVQMLERQHAQLIAGLQELYRRTQNGQGLDGPPLDPVINGQPPTHKILASLGVLCTDEWDGNEGLDGLSSWQSAEQQSQQGSGIVHDDSGIPSPATAMAISPLSITSPAFPQPTIMAKPRPKYEGSVPPTSHTLPMASLPVFPPYMDDYKSPLATTDSAFAPHDHLDSHLQTSTPLAPFNNAMLDNDNLPCGNMDWSLAIDDIFDVSGNQAGLPLQAMG